MKPSYKTLNWKNFFEQLCSCFPRQAIALSVQADHFQLNTTTNVSYLRVIDPRTGQSLGNL